MADTFASPLDGAEAASAALAGASLADAAPVAAAAEQVVTPWDVQGGAGGIDYDKLLTTFGCQSIDAALIARCAPNIGGAHSSLWHKYGEAHRHQGPRVVAARHVLCAQARLAARRLRRRKLKLTQAEEISTPY